jgi:hypothetical protein
MQLVCRLVCGMSGRVGALLTILMAAPSASASVETTLDWHASRSAWAKKNWLYGDEACAHGKEDCNRCAPDVEQQWADMAAGALAWRERSWHFGWDRISPPSYLPPDDTWDAGGYHPAQWEEWWKYHTQGFVRTNNPSVKYAMSHSDDWDGSFTFVNSSNSIHAMHLTASPHPSGLFTLGQYVGLVDGTNVVRFFDTRRSQESHLIRYTMSAETAGAGRTDSGPGVKDANGGIAIAKLFHGGYLVVVGQGGVSNPSQETYFYFTEGKAIGPNRQEYLGKAPYSGPAGAGQSENVSIITECGTGQLYTVHVGGQDQLDGNGWYRLSKVVWGATGPSLQVVNVKWVNMNDDYCHHRSAASASVRSDGTIDLYCHQRDVDNDILSGPGDDWAFREGLNYDNW